MTRNDIITMLETLQEHKHDKTELMPMYIQTRLCKSFDLYNHELQQSILFLTRKHEKSLLKRLNKIDDKTN